MTDRREEVTSNCRYLPPHLRRRRLSTYVAQPATATRLISLPQMLLFIAPTSTGERVRFDRHLNWEQLDSFLDVSEANGEASPLITRRYNFLIWFPWKL